MTTFSEIIPVAKKITKEYDLCNECLGRLFSKPLNLSSNNKLGKKLQSQIKSKSKKCYVCKNIMDDFSYILEKLQEISKNYQYDSFVIGTMLQPSIIDRDDNIRSKFKLKGIDSVKSNITHQLSKQFARKSKKRIDLLDPDITFTMNFKNNSCEIRSKSIYVSGRYAKNLRGLPQKQTSCTNCKGKGCVTCKFHGITEFDSVEGHISKLFFEKFVCNTIKYTWIGGEDKSSLVLGAGRPFFAKIQNPSKRKIRLAKNIKLDSVSLHDVKIISNKPVEIPKFSSSVSVKIKTKNQINSQYLRLLKKSIKYKIIIYEPSGKRFEKSIQNLKFKKLSDDEFMITFIAEGGLPIKRFVEGNEVMPNISNIIRDQCSCKEFDFLEIIDK